MFKYKIKIFRTLFNLKYKYISLNRNPLVQLTRIFFKSAMKTYYQLKHNSKVSQAADMRLTAKRNFSYSIQNFIAIIQI